MRSVTWEQALAWRMRRQFLDPRGTATVVEVVRRLAGVQAQVASAAELAVAVRQEDPAPGEVASALFEERTLLKTWAMRGTLHLLPADEAGAYLALSATVRNWEKASWQKTFGPSPAEMEAMAEAAREALAGGACLTREQLTAEIVERTESEHLAESLGSGWGTVLKPLAWWGVLCFGPSTGVVGGGHGGETGRNRVTFAAPEHQVAGWRGLPPVEEAARTVIRAYFGAHGPATMEAFDAWLMRKTHRKKDVRGWFAEMEGELTTVEVDGDPRYVLNEHVDELLATEPTDAVRLLGGFDQYVLGAGTNATYLIPAERKSEVSRTAGWISPVVVHRGKVAGVWDVKTGDLTLWEGGIPAELLEAEQARLTRAADGAK